MVKATVLFEVLEAKRKRKKKRVEGEAQEREKKEKERWVLQLTNPRDQAFQGKGLG